MAQTHPPGKKFESTVFREMDLAIDDLYLIQYQWLPV